MSQPRIRALKGNDLPEPILKALASSYKPTPNRYSVTTLIAPTTQSALKRKHAGEFVEEAGDKWWALNGQAVHKVLEETDTPDLIKEKFLTIPIGEPIHGLTVSGVADLYDPKTQTLTDYKTTSVYKMMNGDFDEFKRQLQCYAVMLIDAGYPVKKIQNILILRDFSASKARFDKEYPQSALDELEWDFYPSDYFETKKWMEKRAKALKIAELMPDEKLKPCSPEERWHTDDKYKVRKKGRKQALRVLNSQEEAENWMMNKLLSDEKLKEKDLYIEFIQGEDKRCDGYCSVKRWCPYANNRKAD